MEGSELRRLFAATAGFGPACAENRIGGQIGGSRVHAPHQAFEFGPRDRWTELISLVLIASQRLEQIELGVRLDAFGDDLETQIVRQRDDGADDGRVVRSRGDLTQKTAIDLQMIDRESA